MSDSSEVPKHLSDALYAKYRVGEWDLTVPMTLSASDPRFPTSTLRAQLRHFLSAFPGARVRDIVTNISGLRKYHAGRGPLDAWLDSLPEGKCGGAEAALDLKLEWEAPGGMSGETWLPGAAELLLTVQDATGMGATFTLWINLFTDTGEVIRRLGRDRYAADPYPMAASASLNRAHLNVSLRRWESASGGSIEWWESEVVHGIERYGFSDDAKLS